MWNTSLLLLWYIDSEVLYNIYFTIIIMMTVIIVYHSYDCRYSNEFDFQCPA